MFPNSLRIFVHRLFIFFIIVRILLIFVLSTIPLADDLLLLAFELLYLVAGLVHTLILARALVTNFFQLRWLVLDSKRSINR
jgi:hypothetical protein